MRDPVRTVDVLPCSDKVEPGVFITAKGGYVVAGKLVNCKEGSSV